MHDRRWPSTTELEATLPPSHWLGGGPARCSEAAAAVLHITTYAARAAACLEAVALVWGPGTLVLDKEFPRIESPSAIISRLDAKTARKGHSSMLPTLTLIVLGRRGHLDKVQARSESSRPRRIWGMDRSSDRRYADVVGTTHAKPRPRGEIH